MIESPLRILAVDDNSNTLEILERNLKGRGYEVIKSSSVEDALEILNSSTIDLVITDNKMPQVTGMEFLKYLRNHFSHLPVIMITGYATIDGAVSAIKEGADHYLAKPFTSDELLEVISQAIDINSKRSLVDSKDFENRMTKFGLIGRSQKMKDLYSIIDKASTIDATVLVSGESGTGKELVARAIHYNHSLRSSFPFIAVNCPGIPESLFESELFGHEKGSFTGALQTKNGLFLSADKGSIFLDEISELSLPMQVKLLRVIQEKEIKKIGGNSSEKVNVRIIAASNKSLEKLVDTGQFRGDLFFRLNVINIQIPPLRERHDDILLLSSFFLKKYSKNYGKIAPTLSDDTISIFLDYRWPGNVRELENLIQRCVVLVDKNEIDPSDLPDKMKYHINITSSETKTLKEMESDYIRKILNQVDGNKSKAASILQIDRKTLREKIKS